MCRKRKKTDEKGVNRGEREREREGQEIKKKNETVREMKRYCGERGGAGRSLVRSPVMRYGRYGNAAPCHTHTGITARPSIEQPATSLRQHAGERAVELSHIERRGERPHALHTCAAGDTEETEMPGWLVGCLLACLLLLLLLACSLVFLPA